jgi:hypothetical protein
LPKTTVIGRHIFYKKPGDLDNKKEFSGIWELQMFLNNLKII